MREQYALLILRGYHPKAAKRIVTDASRRALGRSVSLSGVGQEEGESIIAKAANLEPIKAARELVSPWLWVTSVVGFALAILNTRRIARMYTTWKRKFAPKKATA
jgi:hypothetical protein